MRAIASQIINKENPRKRPKAPPSSDRRDIAGYTIICHEKCITTKTVAVRRKKSITLERI